jgi:hypothetical protein
MYSDYTTGWTTGVRFATGERIFFHHRVKTGSGALTLIFDENTEECTFTYFIWVWNLVSHCKGRAHIEGENRVWGEHWDLRGRRWRETGEDCIVRSFITCTLHQILIRWSNERLDGWACSTHRRDEKCMKTWREKTTWKTSVQVRG